MKKFYVVGNKVSKSLSPVIFNYWFKKYKIKAKYEYLELNNKNFDKKIREKLKEKDLCGLNITIPFKQKIIKHLQSLDKHSTVINAVNCVSTKPKIRGINTDWTGYYKTLPMTKNLINKNILLIGYGGASLAIHYLLISKGFKNIIVLNRSKKALKYQKNNNYTVPLKKIENYLESADLIINTTPLNPINSRNKKLVKKQTILSDIVYSPKETDFLKAFPNNKKIYGIDMLVQQAIPSFKFWFGYKPILDTGLKQLLERKLK
tara:strand:- start:156 stop:941 length:786 start_codon:yes stop_codon:yes gene_type:complete